LVCKVALMAYCPFYVQKTLLKAKDLGL
jgi:hypothetical protein